MSILKKQVKGFVVEQVYERNLYEAHKRLTKLLAFKGDDEYPNYRTKSLHPFC